MVHVGVGLSKCNKNLFYTDEQEKGGNLARGEDAGPYKEQRSW